MLILFLILYLPTLAGTTLANFFAVPVAAIAAIQITTTAINRKSQIIIALAIATLIAGLIYAAINPTDYKQYIQWSIRIIILHILAAFVIQNHKAVNTNDIRNFFCVYVITSSAVLLASIASPAIQNIVFSLYYSSAADESNIGYMIVRPGLLVGNPNALAISMCFISAIFLDDKSRLRRLASLSLAALIILATLSRTGIFLALFIVLFYATIRKSPIILAGLLLPTTAALAVIGASETVSVYDITYRFTTGLNLAGRDELWAYAINQTDNTIVKIFGSFIYPETIEVIDNEYVNIFIRHGLLGIFAMLFLIAISILYSTQKIILCKGSNEHSLMFFILVAGFAIASVSASPLTSLRLSLIWIFLTMYSLVMTSKEK